MLFFLFLHYTLMMWLSKEGAHGGLTSLRFPITRSKKPCFTFPSFLSLTSFCKTISSENLQGVFQVWQELWYTRSDGIISAFSTRQEFRFDPIIFSICFLRYGKQCPPTTISCEVWTRSGGSSTLFSQLYVPSICHVHGKIGTRINPRNILPALYTKHYIQ